MSGHIRRRGANSWELKFEAGVDPTTGHRSTRYRSFKGTKREAEAELVRLLSEASRGALVDHSRETPGEFLSRWDRDWAVDNVSPKTRERWRQLTTVQVIPRLGSAPIQRIKPSHLAELYATLMRDGGANGGPLAARTVGHVHRLLRPRPRARPDVGADPAKPCRHSTPAAGRRQGDRDRERGGDRRGAQVSQGA
jgi:hypothetical protein